MLSPLEAVAYAKVKLRCIMKCLTFWDCKVRYIKKIPIFEIKLVTFCELNYLFLFMFLILQKLSDYLSVNTIIEKTIVSVDKLV